MSTQRECIERQRPASRGNCLRLRITGNRAGTMGQSLIEFALALPIFLLLLLGAAEFGRLAYAYIEVANAAHAGVQYGAQSHITASDNVGMALAATQDGTNLPTLQASPTHYCTCADGTPSACTAGTCTRLIEYVKVDTSATVNTLFHYPGIPSTITLQGQAIMRVEQ